MFVVKKYNPKIDSLKALSGLISSSHKICRDFFGTDIGSFGVYFVYSRKEFNGLLKRKTPKWMVGASGLSEIVIFSRNVFNKVSNHTRSDFSQILTHEIGHLFLRNLFSFKYPLWLKEGVPGFIAGQYLNRKFNIDEVRPLNKLHTDGDWGKAGVYNEAYLFTKYIVERYGKTKLIKLLRLLGVSDQYNELLSKFHKVYNTDLESVFVKWRSCV